MRLARARRCACGGVTVAHSEAAADALVCVRPDRRVARAGYLSGGAAAAAILIIVGLARNRRRPCPQILWQQLIRVGMRSAKRAQCLHSFFVVTRGALRAEPRDEVAHIAIGLHRTFAARFQLIACRGR